MFNTPLRIALNESKMNRNTALMGLAFFAIAMIAISPTQVMAQDTLTFSLARNFGTGIGSNLDGTFTLHGSGPDVIVGLIVFFNGVEVHSVASNTISWQFITSDYPSGPTNITLYGWDDDGGSYVASQQVTFLSESLSTGITVGIIVLVVVLVLFRYVPRIMSRGNKKAK